MSRPTARGLGPVPICLALAAITAATGCVERRYTIRTNVPAVAVVNDEEIGPTPASKSFTYYGDRDIILIAPGYQTLRVRQKVDAPWWDNLFTEFFTENLIPFTFRDERVFDYVLVPSVNPPVNDLVARAETLRERAKTPPPPRRGGILGFFGF
jgi:hypothetical protein